jgi:hypothetical protein
VSLLEHISQSSVVRFLASVRLYVYLSVITTIALITGTLIPQVAAGRQAQRSGMVAAILQPEDIYHSWWFVALLCLLAANILCCTLEKFSLRLGRVGVELCHFGMVLTLIGGAITGALGQRGMIGLRVGQSSDSFYVDTAARPLGFALQLNDFKITRAESGGDTGALVLCRQDGACRSFPIAANREHEIEGLPYQVSVLKYVPELKVDMQSGQVYSASNEPNNPAIQVQVRSGEIAQVTWLFAKYPDMHLNRDLPPELKLSFQFGRTEGEITDFVSTVSVIDAGKTVLTKTVRVNDPLRYGGYSFYQSQYNPEDPQWTGLDVVRDPGVIPAELGFCMIIAGLVIAFYVKPYIEGRGKPNGKAAL